MLRITLRRLDRIQIMLVEYLAMKRKCMMHLTHTRWQKGLKSVEASKIVQDRAESNIKVICL